MENLKFRTNVRCSGCIEKANSELVKILPEGSWSFDLNSPDKILTVEKSPASAEQIIHAVHIAGYGATRID